MAEEQATGYPSSLKYEKLKQCHPDYDGGYLRRLEALYSGGRKLLGNGKLLADIFPKNRQELPTVYAKRLAMAFYVGIAGEIVDTLVATIMGDPVRAKLGEDDGKNQELPKWYSGFLKHVSPKGAPRMDAQELAREIARAFLVKRTSWIRIDLPRGGTYANRADQEKAGALDAYLVPIPTECVIDWEEDEAGSLTMVVVHSCESKRGGLAGSRDTTTDRWMIYDATGWARYEFTHKNTEPIQDSQDILRIDEGAHTFGRVPIVRKVVPDGLWAMDTLEGLAREHFNKRSALAWAEFQSLLPELYEFLGPEQSSGGVTIGESQKDAGRAAKQPRGQGFVQERGSEDDAKFVGPDVSPFAESRKSCEEIRDEMHRVMHLMALSQATSASMLGRSAASKKEDSASTNIVAGEIGRYLREHFAAIMEMVSIARGESDLAEQWNITGASNFTSTSKADVISEAVEMETVTIKSPTFKRLHQAAIAEAVLGERATPAIMETIEKELAKNVTDEDVETGGAIDKVDLGGDTKKTESDEPDEEGKGEAA